MAWATRAWRIWAYLTVAAVASRVGAGSWNGAARQRVMEKAGERRATCRWLISLC